MNFATLKGLTIPEGNVTQITDAIGRVIWSAAHNVVIAGGGIGTGTGYTAMIDGSSYPFSAAWDISTVSTASVTITSTSTIGKILLNGETVLTGAGEYTLSLSDATHVVMTRQLFNLMITTYSITEQKDVTVTVSGVGYQGLSQIEHNGLVYTSAAKFTAKTGDLIHVNASSTTAGKSDYYYLVVSDALFTLSYSTGGSGGANGSVAVQTIRKDPATITINSEGFNSSYGGSVVVNAPFPSDGLSAMIGATNNPCTVMTSSTGTWSYDVPAGTTITCTGVTVIVNGTQVSSSTYTVTGDATLRLYASGGGRNVVAITET